MEIYNLYSNKHILSLMFQYRPMLAVWFIEMLSHAICHTLKSPMLSIHFFWYVYMGDSHSTPDPNVITAGRKKINIIYSIGL